MLMLYKDICPWCSSGLWLFQTGVVIVHFLQ